MSEKPFMLNPSGSILEITLCKGKANVISAEDSRALITLAFPLQRVISKIEPRGFRVNGGSGIISPLNIYGYPLQ